MTTSFALRGRVSSSFLLLLVLLLFASGPCGVWGVEDNATTAVRENRSLTTAHHINTVEELHLEGNAHLFPKHVIEDLPHDLKHGSVALVEAGKGKENGAKKGKLRKYKVVYYRDRFGVVHAVRRRQLEHPGRHAAVFLFMMFFLVGCQSTIFYWKRVSPKTFRDVTLAGLWLIPAVASVYLHGWFFLSLWALHTILGGYLVYIATRKPLGVHTPQKVYTWFQNWHSVCYGVGCGGYVLILLSLLGLDRMMQSTLIPRAGLTLLLGGAYFGVMGRDFAETCCERISSTIGYCAHDEPPVNLCALCGEELRVSTISYRNGETPPKQQKLFVLNCKHEFHECKF